MDTKKFTEIKDKLSILQEANKISVDDLSAYKEDCLALIKKEPRNSSHYMEITRAMILLGEQSEALAILEQAGDVDKKHVLLAAQGAVYSQLQKWPEAAAAYRAALAEEPDNMGWLYRLAVAEYGLGRYEKSREAIERIFILEENGAQRFKNRSLLSNLCYWLFRLCVTNNNDMQFLMKAGLKKADAAYCASRKDFQRHARNNSFAGCDSRLCALYGNLWNRVESKPPSPKMLEKLCYPVIIVLYKNSFYAVDYASEHVNVKNGRRLTSGRPLEFDQRLYTFGPSSVFGHGCADKHTIASFLQSRCNAAGKKQVAVTNYGIPGQRIDNTLLQIMNTDFKAGDIVIFMLGWFEMLNPGVEAVTQYARAINEYCLERGVGFFLMFLPRLREMSRLESDDKKLQRIELIHWPIIPSQEDFNNLADRLIMGGVKTFDLQYRIDGKASGNLFFWDSLHLSPNGNKAIADAVFSLLEPQIYLKNDAEITAKDMAVRNMANVVRTKYVEREDSRALEVQAWLKMAADAAPRGSGPFGAIVMNCNPFTKGHQYLVRKALKQVEGLYIFVVQEDASQFSFEDRLFMARAGTDEFGGRVSVLPSGPFIISSFSFQGYFSKEKDELADTNRDPSLDVAIFGGVIAPALNINRRFIGEEPFCQVTSAYNKSMLFILPSLGVEISIIKRLCADGQVISASSVRAALKAGQWDRIKDMVPASTWDYLQKTNCGA